MTVHESEQIGRGTIRGWLENYHSMIAEDKSPDETPRNSGSKPDDGVSDGLLNRIVLAQALKALSWEAEILYKCVRARWIDQEGYEFSIERLDLSKDKYYKRCEWAIDFIYYNVNGMEENKKSLLDKLKHHGIL